MALDFLKFGKPALIGVDISTSAVKLIEISDAGKGLYRVERYFIEPLPRDAVVDGNIANLEIVGDAVKRGWTGMATRTKNVALALPMAAVISKKIVVPANLSETELEALVEIEANQAIPFALDEVNLDFQVIGPAVAQPGQDDVIIAASRKEKVNDRVAAVEAAGLKAIVMDVDSFATQTTFDLIAKQLPEGGAGQTVAIVDVGAAAMHLQVIDDLQAVYARDQSFGGNFLTQEIQRRFSLSWDEAESAKRSGGLPESYESEVLQPFMDTLGMEVNRALQLFFTSTHYNKVDHVLLAGGCAAIPGLDEAVATRTGASTLIANPFANMALSPDVNPRALSADAPALVVACGLAIRRFDP